MARPGLVGLGWALAAAVLVVTSAGATTVLLWIGIGTAVVGVVGLARDQRGLRQRTTLMERQLRVVGGQLNHVLQRPEGLADSLGRTLAQTTTKSVAHSTEVLRRSLVKELTTAYHELEALQNLYAMVAVDRRVPPMRGWAASPDLVLLLVEMLRAERPELMVECGSGASTLWAALAIRQFGLDTRLVALEHDTRYARETTDLLAAHGVADLAEVRHAPLEPFDLDGGTWQWYARVGWEDLRGIDLLFVDGPPGKTGPLARFPALPLLGRQLTDDAVVVLDDLVRAEEQEIVQRWLGAAPGVSERRVSLEKGGAILRRRTATPGAWIGLPHQASGGHSQPSPAV
jgi:predicted O-methyltransferase YrrM